MAPRSVWTSDGFFEVEVGSAEYKRLLSEGHELVARRPEGTSDVPVPGAFETWKVPQLKAEAEQLGIYDTIEGTGQSGSVTKPDLVAALETHAASVAAGEDPEAETLNAD